MPASKHRRKPGQGKARKRPGRLRPVLVKLSKANTEAREARLERVMDEAYRKLVVGRVAPELIEEFLQLSWEARGLNFPDEAEERLCELEGIIDAAVPAQLVRQHLIENTEFNGSSYETAIPSDYGWYPLLPTS